MAVEFVVGGQGAKLYLTWAPVAATVRWIGPGPAPASVTLANAGVGQVEFGAGFAGPKTPTLQIALPADGSPAPFFVGGAFPHASVADQDAVISATDPAGAPQGTRTAMVRIRKNATQLTAAERDRFLAAVGALNARGAGPWKLLRDMHVAAAYDEEHGDVQFLPWHRAYLLDYERELQAIDASVSAHYWRFDQPAPALFTAAFLGAADPATGRLRFTAGHPLTFWSTDGQSGILRAPLFNVASAPRVLNEAQTLALGSSGEYGDFAALEGNPHGNAHVSFNGPIDNVPTAPRDPLFFLLHSNVDRLWAKWQWVKGRFDPENASSFAPANTPRIGRNLGDTMWPWNLSVTPPRPSLTGLTQGMPASPVTAAPGATPAVGDMLDFQGALGAASLGFDYDDVPFSPQAATS